MVESDICKRWLHCKCVGHSSIIASSTPFICVFCLKSVFQKISQLQADITNIQDSFTSLESYFNNSISSPVKAEFEALHGSLRDISSKIDSLSALSPQANQTTLFTQADPSSPVAVSSHPSTTPTSHSNPTHFHMPTMSSTVSSNPISFHQVSASGTNSQLPPPSVSGPSAVCNQSFVTHSPYSPSTTYWF